MSTSAHHRTSPVNWADPSRAVVVGVDGSTSNTAAVDWASREAEATGRPLTLLAVLDDFLIPVPHHSMDPDDERAWRVLNAVSTSIRQAHPHTAVRRDVQVGGTVTVLLDRSVGQHLVVVGKRGLGSFGRMMLGSTSTGLAGRSRVPVVIVPDGWDQEAHAREPIVVGVDPLHEIDPPLRWAISRAARDGVPLQVGHGTDLAGSMVWDPRVDREATREWTERLSMVVRAAVGSLTEEYGDVDVEVVEEGGHPADLLLRRAAASQLLVIGRRHPGRVGFSLGSVARGVLHYADVPVAVVPSS